MLALERVPHIASSLHLPRRYESEGRSHAFNSSFEADGSGIIGIPTVARRDDSDRAWWRSDASDLSFLTLNPARDLTSAGELLAPKQEADPSYKCEVSCIDWYGNSRPIFTDDRIFGLMGKTLVEAVTRLGRIEEIRRLDLTAPSAAIVGRGAARGP